MKLIVTLIALIFSTNSFTRAFSKTKKMTSNLEKTLSETKLGVDAKKNEDFSTWYTQVEYKTYFVQLYELSLYI